MLELKVEFKRE